MPDLHAFHQSALAGLLDPQTHAEAFANGCLLAMPPHTLMAVSLFVGTGNPAFLGYACVGAAGNVVLVHALRGVS